MSGPEPAFAAEEIAALDHWAMGWSWEWAARGRSQEPLRSDALNHVLMLGDSFAAAQGSVAPPARLTGPLGPGVFMIGQSEHPRDAATGAWLPIGKAELQPLRGTVLSHHSRRQLLDEAATRALGNEGGLGNHGESAGVAALHQLRHLAGPGGALLLTNAGRPGVTIEMISKGAQVVSTADAPLGIRLYDRALGMVPAARARAEEAGLAYRAAAIVLQVGRTNYVAHASGNRPAAIFDGEAERRDAAGSRAEMLGWLRRLKAEFGADLAAAAGPPGSRPAWFCFVPGETYTRDDADLGVAEAFLQWAEEDDEVVLAGPQYQVTDNTHLDWNGQRWSGCKLGEVMHRCLALGERWRPLSPIRLAWRGRDILAAFHVPAPPLGFAPVWSGTGYRRLDFADRGFRVLAGDHAVPIEAVTVAAPRVLHIRLAAAPKLPPVLQYAPMAGHRGHGNVCDGGDTPAIAAYEFDPASMPPAADIPELVGRPYDMRNWCVPFHRRTEPA
jgi:hypothetical protein